MKVTIDLNTGLLIESQCDEADDEAMLSNAANMGHADAEVRIVSAAELAALIAARDLAGNPNKELDAQIAVLEGTTERGVREAMLYTLVALAEAQGITEPQLYAANYGYRKARDLDSAIAAHRAQRA